MTSSNGLGDLMRDPDEAQARIDQWAQGFAAKAQRYQAAQERTEQIRLTATSSDGAVKVTVGADGSVTDLVFSNKVRSFPLPELSAQILTTMRRAQADIATRVAEVMTESLGDEDLQTRSLMLNSLRSRFPDPEEEADGPATPPPASPMPPPPPPAPAPPRPSGAGPTPGPAAPRRPSGRDDEDEGNSPW
jgi:DNA-binding protein YbaB